MLSIKNVTKYFDEKIVLNNISIEVEKNSVVGLAGLSGGGKSTLLRCIQGLEDYQKGEIVFEGLSGFMFQDFQLFPHMSVKKNLTYAPKINKIDIDYETQADILLSKLGIADKKDEKIQSLSGGQKQRVALARSLMMQPKLLLCDEPTSGLDVVTINDIISLLKSVSDMGVTMVIASHDLDFLSAFADRVILLRQGQIATDIIPKEEENPIAKLKSYY